MFVRAPFLLFFLFLLPPGALLSQSPADSSLVLHLPFRAGARDESVWRHPVIEHHATYGPDRFGQANGAFYGDGSEAFLEILAAPTLDLPGSLTLCLWMKLEEAIPVNTFLTLAGRNENNDYSSFSCRSTGAGIGLTACRSGNQTPLDLWYLPILEPGRWYHIAVSLDVEKNENRLYVDGQLRATLHLKLDRVIQPDMPVTIGARVVQGVPSELWKGWIDDVRLYNRALGADEIQALTAGYAFRPAAAAYVKADRLESGRYILTPVIASDSLDWNPRLYVVPDKEAVWKKGWFLGMMVTAVAAFSLLGAWFFYRQRQLEQNLEFEKIRTLEAERFRIAREMHEDIGTGLSALNLLTDMALHKNLDPGLAAEIEHIAASSRQVSERIREIVWAIDMRHDSLDHLIAYFQQYAADFFQQTGTAVHFTVSPGLPTALLPGNSRRMLFLAYKEALHNTLKHAHATRLDIDFACTAKHLEIRIRDNGRGFDPAAAGDAGNGLVNMRKRMEDIGGAFRIESGGTGTEVVFRMGW